MLTFCYFYKITNLINNKFYYGVHKTKKLNDKYLGSGTRLDAAKKKYGRENFRRDILFFFKTYKDALIYEAFIVNKEMVDNPNCYNLIVGGTGGNKKPGFKYSVESKKLMSEKAKARTINRKGTPKGIPLSEERKKQLSISGKKGWIKRKQKIITI